MRHTQTSRLHMESSAPSFAPLPHSKPITRSYATPWPCSWPPSWPAFPPKHASSPAFDSRPHPTLPVLPPSSYTHRCMHPFFPPRSPYPLSRTTQRRRSIQSRIPTRGGWVRRGVLRRPNLLMGDPAGHSGCAVRSTAVRRGRSSCLRAATIRRTIWQPARCSRRRLGLASQVVRPAVRGRHTRPSLALNLPAGL